MKHLTIVFGLLFSALAFGQTAPPVPVVTPPANSPVYPANFFGAGAGFNASTSVSNGWATYAHKMQGSVPIYSFTTTDITSVSAKTFQAQTSVRTGLATVIKQLGRVTILGVGDVGTAIAGGNLGAAFSGGGYATVRVAKDWHIVLGARVLKTTMAAQQAVYEFGLGRSY